ncbi:hypothetical protein HPB50_013273 [Hyalomma asiaticum]|uniref:Uncharacterized protein n=1 Tax=Hyalomma asiaticum TaxID=266040 RepID=A0ACB7T2D4_HYAAI|nr:hypothetical protein HPB50_013273 [Hyalomma asiaticum]
MAARHPAPSGGESDIAADVSSAHVTASRVMNGFGTEHHKGAPSADSTLATVQEIGRRNDTLPATVAFNGISLPRISVAGSGSAPRRALERAPCC